MHLVIGATGSLGGHIANRLLRQGKPVRALVRESSDYSQLQALGAEIAPGDLKKRESLDRACVGVQRIVATATAAARSGEDTVEAVDQAGYANLIQAAGESGVEQFVFVSALGFEAHSPVALARAKVATEVALENSGLSYTILRPALFMESWIGRVLGGQLQAGPRLKIMGDRDRLYPFVAAHNVADLALAVLGHPEVDRERIPLSAQAVSYGQLCDWILGVTGRPIVVETIPPGTALPGLPPVVTELWTWACETGIDPIETVGVAVKFGLSLETPKAFIERTFA